MRRRLLTAFLVAVTILTSLNSLYIPALSEDGRESLFDYPFDDIAAAWYERSAVYMFEHGYITGTSDGRFSPDAKVTRAMAVQILSRIDRAATEEYGDRGTFSDVARGAWYHDAVEWAAEVGISSGTGDGYFSPDAPITRQEIAVMLYKNTPAECFEGERVSDSAALDVFSDKSDVAAWAHEAVAWALKVGIISGRGDGILAPTAYATRAEAAVMLCKYESVCGHKWGEAEVIIVRTCTTDGIVFYYCEKCGELAEITLPAYHTYVQTAHRDATCTAEGETVYTCKYCGDEKREAIAMIPHKWNAGVYEYGNCETGATYTQTCAACGITRQTVKKTAHKWNAGKVIASATCYKAGTKRFTCTVCSAVKNESIPTTTHNWVRGKVTKYPTYNKTGLADFKCSICGATKTDTIPACGRTTGYDSNGDKRLTIDEFFGAYGHVDHLESHKSDYIGTRYASIVKDKLPYWQLTRNKGDYGASARLNCTGFIACTFLHVGADFSRMPSGGGWYANAHNWYRTINNYGVYHYTFASVSDALASGKMRKGDIMLFIPTSLVDDDYHFGFFWGDTPTSNWFWHSDIYGNRQSRISSFVKNIKCIWVLPMQGE